MVLQPSRIHALLGYVGIAFAGIVGIMLAINIYKTLDIILMLGGVILAALAWSLWLIFRSIRLRVEYDREKIYYHGIDGKMREIAWRDVNRVDFDRRTRMLSLRTPTERVRVYMHLPGFDAFFELMKKKLDHDLYKDLNIVG
jgi:hypothetical protein